MNPDDIVAMFQREHETFAGVIKVMGIQKSN
jgi:hypothetical protein